MNHQRLILGSGPVASVLGAILSCPVLRRHADDQGWEWPKKVDQRLPFTIALVVDDSIGLSRVVRLHGDSWRGPANQRQVAIYGLSRAMAEELRSRDVFARRESHDNTFDSWSDCIRIVSREAPFAVFLDAITGIQPQPVTTWLAAQRLASCLEPLATAIRQRDALALHRHLSAAANTDWDGICFPTENFANGHQYANAISTWIKDVTAGVTPDWQRGAALFQPLTTRSDA